ncbi:MAG TPA: RHS repeat-associated core domain-containing protein [Emticicia sp.]
MLKRKLSNGDVWVYQDEQILKNGKRYQLGYEEGRAVYDTVGNKWLFEFEYRDHLGNLRVSFRDSLAAPVGGVYKPPVVMQVNDYDPWGMVLEQINFVNNQNKINNFDYSNRERQSEFGLNVMALGARMFDPVIGRFWSIDPITEGQENLSPYQYEWNNPVFRSDPEGTCPIEPCSQSIVKSDATRVNLRPLVNVPNTGSTSPAFSITVTSGKQFGAQANIGSTSIGAEVNFGSKEVFKMTEYGSSSDLTVNGAQNSVQLDPGVTKGFSISAGPVSIGAEEKITSETIMTSVGGSSLQGPAVKTTKENQASVEMGIKNTPLSLSLEKAKTTTIFLGSQTIQHGKPAISIGAGQMTGASKEVKGIGMSVSAYYKIDVKFDPIQAFKNFFNIK